MCVSVPYGNTEGPVGYTSVRRLQHVHMWMRVDAVRAVCAIHSTGPMCCKRVKCAHRSYHVHNACVRCKGKRVCDGTGKCVREATSLSTIKRISVQCVRALANEDGGTPHPMRACESDRGSVRAARVRGASERMRSHRGDGMRTCIYAAWRDTRGGRGGKRELRRRDGGACSNLPHAEGRWRARGRAAREGMPPPSP